MNRLFPENSYTGNCSCGTDFIAPKGTLHCHNCLYNKIAELEEMTELLFDCCDELDVYSQRKYNANYIKALALKESSK